MTTTHDTAATLEAAIDDYGNATAREAMNADERAALHSAITAHVEAEVARRLAAAPDVEQQIDLLRRTAYGATITGVSVGGMRETIDRLRAAIAADKARAVESARPTPDEARRLVDAFVRAVSPARYDKDTALTARTALLRALGVEA